MTMNMEEIGEQVVSFLNKILSSFIDEINTNYNIDKTELQDTMNRMLIGFKISNSIRKKKKCKNENCDEFSCGSSLYCEQHKGGRKKKKEISPPVELLRTPQTPPPTEEEFEEVKTPPTKLPPAVPPPIKRLAKKKTISRSRATRTATREESDIE